MIKSICPYCKQEAKLITWDLENVRCSSCWKIFDYRKILHIVVLDDESKQI